MGKWSYHPDVNVESIIAHSRPDDSFNCPRMFRSLVKKRCSRALSFTVVTKQRDFKHGKRKLVIAMMSKLMPIQLLVSHCSTPSQQAWQWTTTHAMSLRHFDLKDKRPPIIKTKKKKRREVSQQIPTPHTQTDFLQRIANTLPFHILQKTEHFLHGQVKHRYPDGNVGFKFIQKHPDISFNCPCK